MAATLFLSALGVNRELVYHGHLLSAAYLRGKYAAIGSEKTLHTVDAIFSKPPLKKLILATAA